jgi:capsular exopolysaccharide synthesis family protein
MTLRRLLRLLRRGWLLLALGVLIGAGAGFAVLALQPATYQSDATVRFALSLTNGSGLALQSDADTYTQDMMPSYLRVMQSSVVLNGVVSQLHLPVSADDLAKRVTVTSDMSSPVADISVVDSDPRRAADIANAVAAESEIAIRQLAPAAARKVLGVVTVTPVSTAQPASAPLSPGPVLDLGLGLVIGLLAGAGILLARELVRTPLVADPAGVAAVTTAPVLSRVPFDAKSAKRPLPVVSQPLLARAESFRFLQSTVVSSLDRDRFCVLVTSGTREDGVTSVAANLGVSLALSDPDRRVLLVDADIRGHSLGDLLGRDRQVGLTSVLNGSVELEQAVTSWRPAGMLERPELAVLPSGPAVEEPADLLASTGMASLLARLREECEVVVIDAPPLDEGIEAAVLAAEVDGTVLVVDAPRTRQRELREGLEMLTMAGVRVLGVVLNRTPGARERTRSARPLHTGPIRRRPLVGSERADSEHVDDEKVFVPSLPRAADPEQPEQPEQPERPEQPPAESRDRPPASPAPAPPVVPFPVPAPAPVRPGPATDNGKANGVAVPPATADSTDAVTEALATLDAEEEPASGEEPEAEAIADAAVPAGGQE